MEHSESYTCVTSHVHDTKHIYTHCSTETKIVQHPVHVRKQRQEQRIWDVASPPESHAKVLGFPVAHFLTACYLCNRQLSHGKDIYMYRGDKAFCSMECRDEHILKDDSMVLSTDFDG